MTTWIEETTGGRDRGPRALLRAWVEVLRQPRRFFQTGIAPGDQAPGLVFGMAVVAIAAGTHLAGRPPYAEVFGDSALLSLSFVYAIYVVVIGPAVLHLVAAIQTATLIALAPERGGVSETVQLIAYAAAPCVYAGLPFPVLRLLVTTWGAALLILGTVEVHNTTLGRAVLATTVPAIVVFGYGFGGFDAAKTVGRSLLGL